MKSIYFICTIILLSLLTAACNATQILSGNTSTASVPTQPSHADNCKKQGGEWVRGGILGLYGCLRPAKDAGKICTNSDQCQYGCNARPGSSPRPGEKTTGQCQKDNNHAGCRIDIKNGIAQPKHCVTI
ncbi:MAG: Unknown protein [uncultured Thiotrichaceae bacterium]|uniref:Secreted protein n=1 Tax=uncultured Thiotrichaceae bacterium TaxID=298394 RepID=A0A6S6SJD6_9GAMM|nr:MAG: Unknown protein [uncultured Thiotrichaceae bacterium]